MAEYENFDRQYRLAAGPGGGEGFEVGETSEANPVPLHVSFSLQKTDLQEQNTGRVTVWNLNPTQLATLDQKDCALSLKAGYGNRLSLIFAGVVSFVSTTADGADRKTEIEVVDNLIENPVFHFTGPEAPAGAPRRIHLEFQIRHPLEEVDLIADGRAVRTFRGLTGHFETEETLPPCTYCRVRGRGKPRKRKYEEGCFEPVFLLNPIFPEDAPCS